MGAFRHVAMELRNDDRREFGVSLGGSSIPPMEVW